MSDIKRKRVARGITAIRVDGGAVFLIKGTKQQVQFGRRCCLNCDNIRVSRGREPNNLNDVRYFSDELEPINDEARALISEVNTYQSRREREREEEERWDRDRGYDGYYDYDPYDRY